MMKEKAVITGHFDDIRSSDIRFLEEASKLGNLHIFLWSDELINKTFGKPPRFPLEERFYLLDAIRYVTRVHVIEQFSDLDNPTLTNDLDQSVWVFNDTSEKFTQEINLHLKRIKRTVIKQADLVGFPDYPIKQSVAGQQPHKVVVSGCFDWFHSGHVRFFEEVSAYGDLYVVVGSDENVRMLKGAGHPMFPQDERRYVVQSIRYVAQALVSSGSGWLDAEPEIMSIQPHFFAVNEDGDKPEKRNFCEQNGIQYVVLKRTPKDGLPKRQSVDLRGF